MTPIGAALKDAGLSALVALGLFGAMLGVQTEAAPGGLFLVPRPGLLASAVLAVFVGLQLISPATGGDPVTIASYAEAFLVFAAAYAARAWLPDWRVLRALARISYPLYAVHLMAGFALLTFMIAGPPGWPFEWAGGAVLAILLALATALHWGIERHTIRWGAALGRINPRAGTPASHPGAAAPPARPPARQAQRSPTALPKRCPRWEA